MRGKADLNVRIYGTFTDEAGNVREIDHTYENMDGLFMCCVKYLEDNHCQQDVATVGLIASYSWPKFIEAMGQEIGPEKCMEAMGMALAAMATKEKESIQVDTDDIQKQSTGY